MRVAVLVLAQKAPRALAATAAYFAPSEVDLFVHVDAKTDLADYLVHAGALPPRVNVLESRRKVYWAGFSIVEATLDLLRAAMRAGPYERYVLISDDCLPVQSLDGLLARLAGCEDMIVCRRPPEGHFVRGNYERFYLLDGDTFDARRGPILPQAVDDATQAQIEALLAAKRRGKKPLDMFYGHMFWALAQDSARLALDAFDNDSWFVESSRFSAFSDEFFIQSLVGAAKYPEGLDDSPVYADFCRFAPRILNTARDLPFDMHPNFLFLRKVAPDFEPGLPEAALRLYGGLRQLIAHDPGVREERAVLLGEGEARTIHLFAPADDDPEWSSVTNLWGRRARWTTAPVSVWRLRARLDWRRVKLTLTCVYGGTDARMSDAFFEIDGQRAALIASDVGYAAEFGDLAAPFDTIRLQTGEGPGFSVAVMPEA